jgi:NAD(P)-dependent dehydrogenase (short-subunit alcohol dehydrogenase family)
MSASSRPVALITGSATGIGAACARRFAQRGWDVGITTLGDHTAPLAQAVAADCRAAGARAWVLALDVRVETSCREVAATLREEAGRLDALVNGAGVTRLVPHHDLEALTEEDFTRTHNVNLVGTFRMIRACQPALAAARGSVVNLASIAGVSGVGSSVAYAASKGAVLTLTKSLARALAPAIRVNAIAPGYVADGLLSRTVTPAQLAEIERTYLETQPLPRLITPPEIAALAFFLAAEAPGMTGEVVRLDGGLHLRG